MPRIYENEMNLNIENLGVHVMKKNVGSIDQIIRIVLGVALLSLVFLLKTDMRWIGLIGTIPLVTGLAGSCLLYSLLGINTSPVLKDKA